MNFLNICVRKVVTVSVDKEIEEEFRNLAFRIFSKKGYYSRALEEAMKEWIKKRKREDIVTKAILLLEGGVEGERWVFKREEIYER